MRKVMTTDNCHECSDIIAIFYKNLSTLHMSLFEDFDRTAQGERD